MSENNDFLPFAKPSISEAEIAEVVACLRSGWLTTGPRVAKFETMLADYLNAPHVLAVNSATAGLHIALLALDLQPGDEVITSSLTFVATLNTIVQAGGKPVLVDIDPNTCNLTAEQIKTAMTSRTRAIIPVHFAGLAVDLAPIYALASLHGLRVIEDAAQAIGTGYDGKRIGSFGDVQVFSFHPNKNITTIEGGCVVTRDAQFAARIKQLRFHGIDRDAFNRFAKNGSQLYEVVEPGFKYNMQDIQAALGLHQLPKLDQFIQKRTQLAERYQQILSDWPQWQLPQIPVYPHLHAWHLYTPRLVPQVAGMDRDTWMAKMKEQGIGTGLHYQPVHLFRYYRERFGFKPGDFPIAEDICSRIVSLPLFPDLTFQQQDRVILAMQTTFSGALI